MNLFEVQERLKDFSKDQLVGEMQTPSGTAPPYLVLSELQRRTRMEQSAAAAQGGAPQTSVAEDAVVAAGVPQAGIAGMARALAPQTDVTQNTGATPVAAMADGGLAGVSRELGDYRSNAPRGDAEMTIQEYLDRIAIERERGNPIGFLSENFDSTPFAVSGNEPTLSEYIRYGSLAPPREDDAATGLTRPRAIREQPPAPGQELSVLDVRAEAADAAQRVRDMNYRDSLIEPDRFPSEDVIDQQRAVDREALGQRGRDSRAAGAGAPQTPSMRPGAAGNVAEGGYSSPTYSDLLNRRTSGENISLADLVASVESGDLNSQQAADVQSMIDDPNYLPSAQEQELTYMPGPSTDFVDPSPGGVTLGTAASDYFADTSYQSTQERIDALRQVLNDTSGSHTVAQKLSAARELEALQEEIAVTQTGGNISATARGFNVPEGYMMGAMGLVRDPSYRSPGKTGYSIVDQAAMQGSSGLSALEGIVDPSLVQAAREVANRTDVEAKINPINRELYDIERTSANPYLPESLKRDMAVRSKELGGERAAVLAAAPARVTTPEGSSSGLGGYEDLVDPAPSERPDTPLPEAVASAEEAANIREAAGITAALGAPGQPNISAVQAPAPTGGGTSGGGTSGGVGSASSSGASAGAKSDLEKLYEQDKWLALAQFGTALMSSQKPTFGQAVGDAGQAALAQVGSAREKYLERKQAAELMAMKRAAAARSGRSGGGSGGGLSTVDPLDNIGISASVQRTLGELQARRSELQMQRSGMDEGGFFRGPDARIKDIDDEIDRVSGRINAIVDYSAGGGLSNPEPSRYSTIDVR